MEAILSRLNFRSVVKFMVLTMVITVSYFTLTMLTPSLSFTMAGQFGVRVANTLRALILWSPEASFGVATGSMWASLSTGRLMFPIASVVSLVAGLLAYFLANIGRHSHIKNIGLLIMHGSMVGFAVAIPKIQFANILGMYNTNMTVPAMIGMIMATNIIGNLLGYPLYLIIRGMKK